ncbi:MAG TPA: alpha/beta hydrolase [Acidimicrobiales bacterium]|nr:alpha/beta hydrolase [Acidimicrobiales bacterium]
MPDRPNRRRESLIPYSASLRELVPLGLTANALRPVSRTKRISAWAFVTGWHVSELPMATLAAQLGATALSLRGRRWRTRDGALRITAQAASAAGLVELQRGAADSGRVLERSLRDALGHDYRSRAEGAGVAPPESPAVAKFGVLPTWIARRSRLRASGVSYGPAGKRNVLDIWARSDLPADGKAPVLIQVPGGGWISGETRWQAYPLMARLIEAGWVCVPINYRLSPRATWPDHIVDVKRAIAWVKANIARYGGDPDFVVITGGSAGGHLSSFAAMSANAPEFQPGFEEADTSVQAAVPFYGVYDLTDWDGHGGPPQTIKFVQRMLLKSPLATDRERWLKASPINWVSEDAPPTMLLHGTNDSLVPVEGARRMADALRSTSKQPVVYAELPYAQHAFDIYASLRTRHTVRAVERFLAYVRAGYVLSAQSAVSANGGRSAGEQQMASR